MPGFYDLSDEIILMIIREMITLDCTLNTQYTRAIEIAGRSTSAIIDRLVMPMAFDGRFLTMSYQVVYGEAAFRLRQVRQHSVLRRYGVASALPLGPRRVRHLVLDVTDYLQAQHSVIPDDINLGQLHGEHLLRLARLFQSLRILEIDIDPSFIRQHVRHLPSANDSLRWFLAMLSQSLMLGDMTGSRTEAELRIRVYNAGNGLLGWIRGQQEGTLLPASVVAAREYRDLDALVAEMLFLPHVVVVFRSGDWIAFIISGAQQGPAE